VTILFTRVKERYAMRTRSLGNTDIVTSVLGFGCATLFHVPGRSTRRRVLDAAFAAGIRHYDVAPIYGLGRAEPELAAFLGERRSEVTITTKFGIEPTLFGRAAGLAQNPIRSALRHLPQAQAGLQTSARGPNSGFAGRALYRQVSFSPRSAEVALTRSLQALNTDYVDVFVLHEPVGRLTQGLELADFLNRERDRGRIRAWGTAGEDSQTHAQVVDHLPGVQVVQQRDDLLRPPRSTPEIGQLGRITFGVLGQPLPRILSLLSDQPKLSRNLSDTLGLDVSRPDNLMGILLREALRRNTRGPVLFGTTKPDRISSAVSAVDTAPTALEREVVQELGTAVLGIGPKPIGDSP
jgi:D-threo-aldose 1-dehydrogenase